MKLVPYRREVERPFEEMFNMMDELFNSNMTQRPVRRGFNLDVVENDDAYIVEGELPGIKHENIEISYEKNLLKISVENKEEENVEEKNYIHRERSFYSMERILRFKDIDEEKIQAKLTDGILKVTLPKKEVVENKRRIEIQ